MKNRQMVLNVAQKFSKRFHVKIYEIAICGNHIHCLIRGYNRKNLQNFFRVFSGQIAQEILKLFPLQKHEGKAFRGGAHPKSQKSFWSELVYTRIVSWGRDFGNVNRYIIKNTLEAFGLLPYVRPSKKVKAGGTPVKRRGNSRRQIKLRRLQQ